VRGRWNMIILFEGTIPTSGPPDPRG
jgi:hypothetical protein